MDIKVDNQAIEELVKTHIALAVAQALSNKADYFIQRLVDAAINKPVLDRYNHPIRGPDGKPLTVIDDTLNKMIVLAANEAAQEWVNAQQPEIKKLVRQKLQARNKGLIARIADKLTARMAHGFDVSVFLRCKDDD